MENARVNLLGSLGTQFLTSSGARGVLCNNVQTWYPEDDYSGDSDLDVSLVASHAHTQGSTRWDFDSIHN